MSAFDELVSSRVQLSRFTPPPKKEEEAGLLSNLAHTAYGTMQTLAGDALTALGVNANARNSYLLDEIASNLEAEGNADLATKVRNTPPQQLNDYGNALVNNGQYLTNSGEEIHKQYGTRDKYSGRGLFDLLTDPEFLTDSRGAATALTEGLTSSAPFIAASAVAPEITLPSAVIRGARALPFLGKGADWLLERGVGSLLDRGISGAALTTPADAMLNASEVYKPLKEQGYNDAQIAQRMGQAAYSEMPLDFANNVILSGLVTGKLSDVIAGKGAGRVRRGLSGATTGGIDMAGEGVQEVNQGQTVKEFSNKPHGVWYDPRTWDKEDITSFSMGAMGAGGPAVASTIRDVVKSPDLSDIPMQDIEDAGLANTNAALKGQFRQLFDWANDSFGKQVEVSGGARSEEHNREVNGSPTSNHLHGNAIDVNVSMLTDDEREAFIQKAKEMGFNSDGDDFYHDRGTGYHVHLTYKDNGGNADMSNFNDKQREAWQEAQWVQSQTGIPAEFIYRQWAHESGNFTSRLAQENNNFGGLTQSEPNGEENKQPDGGNYYRQFGNMHEYAQSYVNDFINRYDGKEKVKTLEDFANFLHDNGYYTDSPENYIAGMRGVEAPSGGVDVGGPTTTNTRQEAPKVGTYDDVYEQFAREQIETSTNAEEVDYFSGFFNSKGKFKDTPENRRKLDEDYGNQIREFAESTGKVQKPAPKAQPQETQIESQTENLDKLKAKLGKFKGRAIKRKDFNTATQINKAVQTNDVPAMQNLVNQLEGTQQASSQNVPQAQPAFPIVQTPSQNAPQPAQQTEQAQPIQVPTRANEAPQTDTQQTQEELLKRLQELNRQNGNTQNVINEFDDMQRQLEERAGVQTGGNINGNTQSTQSTQTQPTQSINTANQNQNAEPGQAEAEEVSQPVQQEAPQPTSKRDNFFPYDMTYMNGKTFPVLSYHGKPTEEVNSLAQKYHGVVSPATDRYEGHISFRKGDGRTAEENRAAFLAEMNGQKANAPIEGTSTTTSTPVQVAPKKGSKALSKFRENVAEVIEKYRNDETTYEKAFQKIADMQVAAEHVAPDEATVQEIRQVAEDGINQLNAIFAEKQGTPSQTAQESAGEQETTTQVEEPTQEEKTAQSEAEPAYNEGGEKSAQNKPHKFTKKDIEGTSAQQPFTTYRAEMDMDEDTFKKFAHIKTEYRDGFGQYETNAGHYENGKGIFDFSSPHERDSFVETAEYNLNDYKGAAKYFVNVNGSKLTIDMSDGKVIGTSNDTYKAKNVIKHYGGKWDKDKKVWYLVDPKERQQLIDNFGGHYDLAKPEPAQNATVEENSTVANEEKLKKDYSSMTLDELKAERQKRIDEEVDRWKKNPGGQGVNPVYTYNDRGEINGRYGESLNPDWYQWAYKRNGGKTPAKRDYPMFADEYLRNTQEYDELVNEIERREAEPKQEKPTEAENNTAKAGGEYKYYMNERGVSPGAQPKGFTRFDEEDKGGRYGAIYYDHPLTEQEIADYELTPAKESIFGDEAENEKDLLEALGITEDETEEVSFGNEFGDTTDEEIEALKKELQKELSKLSANPVFNPRIYTLGLQLGGKYIQKGYRTFKKWLDKMTSDLGEPIEPWAPAIWETLKTYPKGQKFDPKQIMAFSKLIGSKFERGVTSLEDVNADMKKLLKGRYKEFAPMIEASYNGIEKYFSTIKEGENNVNDSTRGLASRTGEGVNKDSVGRDDESGRPGRGSKREGGQKAEHDVQQQDSAGIYDSSPSRSGKAGNSGVQAEESADRSGGTRDTELSGSVRDSYEGSVALDDGRKAEDINPAEERPVNAAAEKVSKEKANTPYKAGDLDSIKADLPMLRPEQQEDVQRIEKRLLVDKGQGFLCTNGTGTGKTYSGLGVIKRAYDQGKKNILVVAPKAEIIKQWIEAAKTDFSLDIKQLSDTKDNGGKGICITTYANFQANRELAARDWDMIVADESHTLLENKDASETSALKMLRSLTEHPRQLYNRWKLKNRTKKIRALENKLDEYESKLAKLAADHNKHKVSDSVYGERSVSLKDNIKQTENAIAEEYRSMNDQWKEVEKQWKAIPSEDKPKVLFMSATPFAYDKSIDYVEGYLFNYNEDTNPGSYHNQSGFEQFMIQKFGYRFRYGKLAKPEAQVDNRVMEIQFHDDLVDAGVMYGRQIDLPVDYDRGFLLVDGGIGNKIDEGFRFLWDNNKMYGKLAEELRKQFDTRAKRYLIESIKAKAVVPIVQEYIKSGKKVVLFHQSMKEKLNVHPFQLKNFSDRQVTEQWELFKKERPDLVGLRFDDIPAPMTTLKSAFKDALYLDGSQEHKKDRDNAVQLFQDDDSGKNLIICQQDAANAGVSLHDTTGKHQRVLINIATPERPIYAMQIEGRIYRVGSVTNAIFRYLSTGTELEKSIFANTIGSRAETAENLALGADARGLRDSFTNLFLETLDDSWERRKPGHPEEGTGGKEMDFSGKSDVTLWERAKSFYYGQQKKTSSTKAQEGKDYFATPEPIGLKMVEWLGLKDGDSALEPSAGHGAISRWFSPNTNNTIVEPSGKLAPLAQMVTPNAKVIRTGFEDFNVVNKFDGIAMNPPFGQGGKTAVDHIAKAFRHLKDGGRMVAIIPTGSAADAQFDRWFYGLNKKGEQVEDGVKNGVLTADISLPGVTFNRAGTGVATRLVVIDKHNNEAKQQTAWENGGVSVDLSNIKDINELFDRMENMTVPERVKGLTAQDKAKSTNGKKYVLPAEGVKGNKTSYMAVVNDAEDVTSDDVKELAKTYRGKYIPETDSFVFDFKEERDDFIRAANDLLAKSKNPPELRDSYKGEIDGTPITIHSDGRITGKTYDIKDTIKENGGKWDRDSSVWRINDPAKLTKFINKYNTEGVQVDEQEEDTSTAFDTFERNGKHIAAFKELQDRETFKSINSLAKDKYNGKYVAGKGFVFDTEKDMENFVEEADALLGMGDAKYSKGKEKLRNLLRSMTFPKDSELTSQEQEIVNFGKQLGVKVVWFDGNPNLHGFHQNNITFLNRRSVKDVQTTFYHETFHWLKNNNPAFYQELLASIEKAGVFTQEQLDAYREKTGRYDLSNSDAIEEMLADEFIKPASRHKILGKLAKQNKSVLERLIAWMKRVIDRIASVFHNPQGKLTTAQRDAFVKSFNKMAVSLKDQNGKAIFKTFNNGKEIMLVNGVDLNTVALSKGKAIKATDKQYMDAVDKYQNATSDTERNKAFRELQDMVEDAAELAGFENAIPEQTVAYKTRTKAAPKKSIKVYKVFTVADDGSPTALFVGGTEKLPQGVWLDAMDTYHFQAENGSYYVPSTKNPNSKGGATGGQVKIPNEQVLQDLKERGYVNSKAKVGTSITALAYRPGWHAGTLPFFPQGGTKIKNPDYINPTETPDVAQFADTPYPNVHRYNQVVFECELAFDKDYNEAAQATKDGDLEYLPEDGSYYFATNPLTRANPELGAWVISGSLKIGRALTKEECDTILEEHDMAPQQWEGGQLRKGTEAERQAAIDNYFEEEYAKVDENGKHKKKQFESREVYQKWYDKQMEAYPGKLAEWEKKVGAWEAGGKKGNKPSKPSRPKAIDAMASGYGYISGDLDLAALGYTGPQNDAARKTLAPITYDDNGEVIPLSERFNPNIDDIRFSADIGDSEKSFLDKLAGKFGRKVDSRIQTAQTEAPKGIGLFSYYLGSPSRIAEKVKSFKPFYTMADKAMNLITKNRTDFMRKYEKAWGLCKKQEEKDKLSEILLLGDSEEKEFTREEILAEGGSENVAKAYETLRRLTRKAYNLVNEARKKPKPHSRRLTDDEIAKLKENKFIQIQKITPVEDGRKLVTYKEFANWQKEYDVTPEELARFQADDAIQILESHKNEDGTTHVKVREGIGDLTNRKGYIPHIFHEYMVRVKDKDGNVVEDYGYGGVITSGRNEKEAVAKAEEWLKNNKLKDGETIYVAPKVFNFNTLGMSEKDYGVIMGDKDYDTMMESIADNNEMTLKEVKDMLGGSVRKKNRHRFFGHVLKRQGAKGYEEDMQWALRHYFNSAIRYHAMETEFKPQAISLFERLFGDFDKKHTGIAAYTQDFINDINGNPTQLELWINDTLNRIPAWRKFVVASYGDRAALKAANSVTNLMSHLCLGYLNVSSALLNFSQAINAAAYLGNAKYAPMVIARGSRKFSPKDLKVLVETNVGNDIGLDSGSGYDKARSVGGVLSAIGNKGMILFKKSEQTMRFGTTLVAYDKARAEGKSHDEAIKYAREINRKSNFDYSVADAPNIFRRGSIISQICLQFKKYGFKEAEVVGDMLPGSTKTSKAQKKIFWAMYLLTAGLLQVPLFDWWDKLIGESLYGGKESVQKAIMEAAGDSPLGQVLAKTAMYGIVSNIGIDMSKRTGLADVVPTKWSDLAGPAPSKIFSFINDVAAGNKANAIRDVSPGIYNQYAAWIAGHSEGGRNRTTATYDDTYSKILRSMGFSSTDERMASDIQQIMYKEREKLKAQKQKAIDEFIENPTNENAKRLKELGVKPSTVKKERERKKRSKLDRIKVDMSKEEMKRNKDLFRSAE